MTTETQRIRHSRRAMVESWQRGYLRAGWLGLAPNPLVGDPAETDDAELWRRLRALAAWVAEVERTDFPYLWGLAKGAGALDGMALRAGEDVGAAISRWRVVLSGWFECCAAMKGAVA